MNAHSKIVPFQLTTLLGILGEHGSKSQKSHDIVTDAYYVGDITVIHTKIGGVKLVVGQHSLCRLAPAARRLAMDMLELFNAEKLGNQSRVDDCLKEIQAAKDIFQSQSEEERKDYWSNCAEHQNYLVRLATAASKQKLDYLSVDDDNDVAEMARDSSLKMRRLNKDEINHVLADYGMCLKDGKIYDHENNLIHDEFGDHRNHDFRTMAGIMHYLISDAKEKAYAQGRNSLKQELKNLLAPE